MSSNRTLGIIGGVLIAISVFFSGNSATFDFDRLKGGATIVLFAAGVLVAVLLMMGNRAWAAFAAVAATTLLLVAIFDGGYAINVAYVLWTVGVLMALFATVFGKK